MSSTGIRTYLEPDLAREVARIARAQGRSESALIAESVRLRLSAEGGAATSAAAETQKRQLNRLETRLDKLQRDHAQAKECLLVFVRVWLEHNPPIDDELAESIAASAENRFERFIDLVERGLQPGSSIANGAFGEKANDHAADVEAEAAP